tara:strand:- start:326 stop:550 length:225 start_codon:yes stop_codon:yes gene_type:complete
MPSTRDQYKKGNAIVARALRHNLIPEFKRNVGLEKQTFRTRWTLHVMAVLSKDKKADVSEVKRVVEQTIDLVQK